jgi:hypothetical protein
MGDEQLTLKRIFSIPCPSASLNAVKVCKELIDELIPEHQRAVLAFLNEIYTKEDN